MGESVSEATITQWLKKVGEKVKADEPVVEVATDKVDSEIVSEHNGVIKEILSNVNDASEALSREDKAVFLIVAPQIRRHVANFVRAQLPSVNVLSFTELPENRSVEIAFTIGGEEENDE